mgnify:CR=1 FL=1
MIDDSLSYNKIIPSILVKKTPIKLCMISGGNHYEQGRNSR